MLGAHVTGRARDTTRRASLLLLSDAAFVGFFILSILAVNYLAALCHVDWWRANGMEKPLNLNRAIESIPYWLLFYGPGVVAMLSIRSHRWIRAIPLGFMVWIVVGEADLYVRTSGHHDGDQKGCEVGMGALYFGFVFSALATAAAVINGIVLVWRRIRAR